MHMLTLSVCVCVCGAFDQKIVIEAQLLPASSSLSTSSLNNSRRGVQREWRKRVWVREKEYESKSEWEA